MCAGPPRHLRRILWGCVIDLGEMIPVAVLLLLMLTWQILRRWAMSWGSSRQEIHATLPSDRIIGKPSIQTTHAVTIWATPSQVWPWIQQMGYYRAGWYTDPEWWDRLPDLVLRRFVKSKVRETGVDHRDVPSTDTIVPEYQNLKVGETILDGPPGTAYFTVRSHQPDSHLVLFSDTHLRFVFPESIRDNPKYGIAGYFTWAFHVSPIDQHRSRLILRTRAVVHPYLYYLIMTNLFPVADMALSRKMLNGIRTRAQRGTRRKICGA